jgi:hypothetical protein
VDGLRASGAAAGEAGEERTTASLTPRSLPSQPSVLSLGAPYDGEQACSPKRSFGASFTSKVRVEHNERTHSPHADNTQSGHVVMPRRQHATRDHSVESNPRQPHAATQASSSGGFGFVSWDLPAGHWAFPGVPRSALLSL